MFGMIGTLISLFVGAAVIYAAVLTVNAVINWFKSRASLVNSDADNIAFTIREKLNNGDYSLYQGIFNQRTNTLLDGQKMVGDQMDSELANLHRTQEMVVYQ
ncbi:hypothetical protein [Gimesia maris]|uniref:MotA/TolQ/ExbB proton channel family protein n=1 Tax=Gimesia maris TaxID=122 RepID=A0ABX5YRF0_9PLAN|nr:hypothetical protein [Gimesia maris]EDL59250.1 hypothetical protein PM8797T_23424 [Gimesia maris DSM 8797]QEG18212.1 hypothetical protein GmarT_40980 [Gimesia maris]QGQ28787.1 hypothetical protein F1729_09100 [Gimesia maris]